MLVPSFFFFKETTKHKVGQASAGNWVLLMLFEKVKSVSFHFGKASVRSSSTASQDSSVHQPYSAREWKPPVLFGNLLCYLETATGLSSSAFLSLTSTTFPHISPPCSFTFLFLDSPDFCHVGDGSVTLWAVSVFLAQGPDMIKQNYRIKWWEFEFLL